MSIQTSITVQTADGIRSVLGVVANRYRCTNLNIREDWATAHPSSRVPVREHNYSSKSVWPRDLITRPITPFPDTPYSSATVFDPPESSALAPSRRHDRLGRGDGDANL